MTIKKFKFKLIISLATILILVIIVFLLNKNSSTKSSYRDDEETISVSNKPAPLNTSTSPLNNSSLNTRVNSVNRETVLGHAPEPSTEYGRKIDQHEIERLKEITIRNTKLIYEQMRKEEIKSLENSIQNNEKLLNEIEVSGSNAQDYEYIQANLQKRKKRLKELKLLQ